MTGSAELLDIGARPLGGVRVVDFGQYLAGPLATMLLADQGADVVRVDPVGGPRLHHPVTEILLRGRAERLELDLRDSASLERTRVLVATADVVVENFRPGVMRRLGLGAEECMAGNSRLVYCSLPGFGADDPRAEEAAWEGVVMAAAGAYSLPTPSPLIAGNESVSAGPRFSPLPLASTFGAIEAVTAVTAALIARERDGVGQFIEVPLFDALFEPIGFRAVSYERNWPAVTDFGTGFYRCGDGRWLTFVALWHRHLVRFVEAAGCHGWIEDGVVDFDRLWRDPATVTELRRRMVDLFATRPAAEWEALGWANDCTIGMMRSTAEWLDGPQAKAGGAVLEIEGPTLGVRRRVPGAAVRVRERAVSEHRPPSHRRPSVRVDGGALAGFRVLDLTRVVAGPTAAKLLAQFGAEVIKIDQDPATNPASTDQPPLHEHLNRGKQSISLDLKNEADKATFLALAAGCDVVMQNFTLGVAERLGIDEIRVRDVAPDHVFVYLNTYGTEGPWAGHRGYAELANITTGITERTVGDDAIPSGAPATIDYPRWAFTDYAGGVLGAYAALLGLYHRARTGAPSYAETSLASATTLFQVLYLDGDDAEPRGAAWVGWSARQRLRAAADGWLFVGATSGQLDALGVGERDLGAFLAQRSMSQCVRLLHSVGIGAQPVVSVADLMVPGGMADQRGLRLEEESELHGTVVMPGPVARMTRTPMRPGAYPGPFGSDAAAIRRAINYQGIAIPPLGRRI